MKPKITKGIVTTLLTALFLIFGISSQVVFATTTPYVEWQTIFEGVSGVSRHIEATSDGGAIITGSGTINGVNGLYVSKVDSEGNRTWETIIAKAYIGNSIQETKDNSYIVVTHNGHVVKIDSQGNLLWDIVPSSVTELTAIEPTKDGNFIITGCAKTASNGTDAYLCKIDVDGNIIFTKCIGTAYSDFGESVQQTVDGGYIMLGTTFTSSSYYMYLAKIDRSGNLLWTKSVGAQSGMGKDIKVTVDGSFILAGSVSFKGTLMKTDSSGVLKWTKTLNDWSIDGIELDTDGFMLVGTVDSSNMDNQVMKTDLNGNKTWSYENTEYNSMDLLRSVTKLADGSYLTVGDTQSMDTYLQQITLMKVKY
jgi:hypothetical protein